MAREFVTVAEEVHFIYPEGAGNLERLKGDPAHEFFKKYGQAMPPKDWRDPGTKQGVYMIGPNAEYLEGGGAISGSSKAVHKRLLKALERWQELRKDKKYSNLPVPAVNNIAVPEVVGKPMVLRIFLRDLPRGQQDNSGRRFTERDLNGIWPDFKQWAWNTNWMFLEDPKALVPEGREEQEVSSAAFHKICRQALVDNVRGQNPHWHSDHVKVAKLTMRRLEDSGSLWNIEYRGNAAMDSGRQQFAPVLYGRGVWNPDEQLFESLELLAIGDREGAGTFNQRGDDPGPAPMGVAVVLHREDR